jgi:hypothetical protein
VIPRVRVFDGKKICLWDSNEGRMRPAVNHWKTALSILAALSASLALAEDFKTINGKEYKGATVAHVEPDGIVLKTKSGISKVYFVELPKEVQQRFNYNPQQAAAYSAAEAANATSQNQRQKQLDETQRQQATVAQNLAKVGQIQATVNAISGLEGRLAQIQSEKAMLRQRINEMERWHLGRLERADLADLRRQLAALESEEREVKSQLNQS